MLNPFFPVRNIRENVEADSCLIPILLNNFVSDSEEYYVEKESEDICSEV